MKKPRRHSYTFGAFNLDPRERLLRRDGEVVPLTPKCFDILLVLVENKGHLVRKEELLKAVWPEAFVEEGNLSYNISILRKVFGRSPDRVDYIETVPRCGYRFVATVRDIAAGSASARKKVSGSASEESMRHEVSGQHEGPVLERAAQLVQSTHPSERLEPVRGAVSLDSRFYVIRPADAEIHTAIVRHDSIVLVKGARQVGKTSLLARGLQRAREVGARVVLTDFEALCASDLESAQALFMTLGKSLAEQLELSVSPKSMWDAEDSANTNFGRFMKRAVLEELADPLVWGLDEVDRLFTCSFGSEVFSLFRFWHNKRALEPGGPWHRLTLAIAYATEAHLFIANMNQSPFNVGTRVVLEDFTLDQVEDLNRRYDSPLRSREEVTQFYGLVGGHPYLARVGLDAIAQGTSLAVFEAEADRDEGLLGDHLRRILILLKKDPDLYEQVRAVLKGQPGLTREGFYRLRSAGVLAGDSHQTARPRCRLYASYLERHFSQ